MKPNNSLSPEALVRRLREYEEQSARMQELLNAARHEAIHDLDTGLYSNSYFHNRLGEEIIRSERYRHFLSLILVHVNVRNAQSSTQVAQEIKRIGVQLSLGLTRRTDIVALYRRRQMIVILPETDARGAQCLIDRYQQIFPDNGRELRYHTLTFPNDATNIEMVLERLQSMSEDLFRGRSLPDAEESLG